VNRGINRTCHACFSNERAWEIGTDDGGLNSSLNGTARYKLSSIARNTNGTVEGKERPLGAGRLFGAVV
jgi:hypothetical protein